MKIPSGYAPVGTVTNPGGAEARPRKRVVYRHVNPQQPLAPAGATDEDPAAILRASTQNW